MDILGTIGGEFMGFIKEKRNSTAFDGKNEFDISKRSSGSEGNLGSFFLGVICFAIGVYLIFQNTIISTQFSLMDIIGFNPPFGLVILPLLIGIGILFFNEKSILGWIVTIFGIITILLGILMGLRIYFRPVTLYQAVLMYGMTAAGIGLIAKAFFGKRR